MLHKVINKLMERPFFYRLVQEGLAGGGHQVIKHFLKKEIPQNCRSILDQGCGTGEYSLLFKNYTGLDNNPEDIKYALKKYQGSFILGSATKMPFKDSSFEAVFAVGLHHHLTDLQAKQAIREGWRVLKKGGKLIIVDAMLPKDKLNFLGFVLRKMDRGGYVRQASESLKLIPIQYDYKYKILSSFPFDYITITAKKF